MYTYYEGFLKIPKELGGEPYMHLFVCRECGWSGPSGGVAYSACLDCNRRNTLHFCTMNQKQLDWFKENGIIAVKDYGTSP